MMDRSGILVVVPFLRIPKGIAAFAAATDAEPSSADMTIRRSLPTLRRSKWGGMIADC